MKYRFIPSQKQILYLLLFCFLACAQLATAQLTNFQQTHDVLPNATLPVSISNSGANTPINGLPVNGTNIPVSHRIVDLKVEIDWTMSATNGCGIQTLNIPNLEKVGFSLMTPFGGAAISVIDLALLNAFNVANPTAPNPFRLNPPSSFGIANEVITYETGGTNTAQIVFPTTLANPYEPEEDFSTLWGQTTHTSGASLWRLGVSIAGAPSIVPVCINNYKISLTTCEPGNHVVACKGTTTVQLDASGNHTFKFTDLDDGTSDVSCIIDNITFSPSTVSCADTAAPVNVIMQITDRLGQTASCPSSVTVVDNIKPLIQDCTNFLIGPPHFDTIYRSASGNDMVYADSIRATDNCSPSAALTRELKPFSGSGPYLASYPITCPSAPRFGGTFASPNTMAFRVRVTDLSGNDTVCIAVVALIDTFAPVALCKRDTLDLDVSGNGTLTHADINDGSTDNCKLNTIKNELSKDSILFSPTLNYGCSDLGVNSVFLQVSDYANNVGGCRDTVFVRDVTPTYSNFQSRGALP